MFINKMALVAVLLASCAPAAALAPAMRPLALATRPHINAQAVSVRLAPPTMSVLSGAMGIPATAAIATAACSLAYFRQAYVFSLSYGLSAAAIGGACLAAAAPGSACATHAILVTAYGVRLFAFLLWRQVGQDAGWSNRLRRLDKTPRAQRTPLILSTALFYALMTSPLQFHLQSAPLGGPLPALGSAIAAAGLGIETLADQQKSLFKIGLRKSGAADRPYTGGVYRYSRHANYLGEIVFWLGSCVAGSPALLAPGLSALTRALRLGAMGLGLAGIVFIMLSATKRLEGKQADNAATLWPTLGADGEFDTYDKYVARTGKLLPRLF